MRVFFQDLHPVLNVGRAALRVVSHPHLLSGHHGADLRPQFLAGILRAPKARRHAFFEGVAVHPVVMPGRMARLVQRRLVVAITGSELRRVR